MLCSVRLDYVITLFEVDCKYTLLLTYVNQLQRLTVINAVNNKYSNNMQVENI